MRQVSATKTSSWRHWRRWEVRRRRQRAASSSRRPCWIIYTAAVAAAAESAVVMTTTTNRHRHLRTPAAGLRLRWAGRRRARWSRPHGARTASSRALTAARRSRCRRTAPTMPRSACSSCRRPTSSTFPTSATRSSTVIIIIIIIRSSCWTLPRWLCRSHTPPRLSRRRHLAIFPATAAWCDRRRGRQIHRACWWTAAAAGCRYDRATAARPPTARRRRWAASSALQPRSVTTAPEWAASATAVLVLPVTCCYDKTRFVNFKLELTNSQCSANFVADSGANRNSMVCAVVSM